MKSTGRSRSLAARQIAQGTYSVPRFEKSKLRHKHGHAGCVQHWFGKREDIRETDPWNKYPELLTWIYVMLREVTLSVHVMDSLERLDRCTSSFASRSCGTMVGFLEHSGLSTICSHLEDPGSKVSNGKWQEMVHYMYDIISAVDFSSEFWHKLLEMLTRFFITITQIDGSSFFNWGCIG